MKSNFSSYSVRNIVIAVIFVIIISSVGLWFFQGNDGKKSEVTDIMLSECHGKLTIVYDNTPYNSSYLTGWGFGCLIELEGSKILFDTGGETDILAHNLDTLGIDVDTIDIIVLSHEHWDHIGGINTVLDNNRDVTVYLPEVFPYHVKSNIRIKGVELIETSNATVVYDCVATTKVLSGNPMEQGLILKTDKGLIVLTGCSHPGVDEIVENAKNVTGEEVYLVMGGYHLGRASSTRINGIINRLIEMDVEKVAPSHCTGDDAKKLFSDRFGDNCMTVGVGFSMEF